MTSIRVTLVLLALTLSLATSVAAQPLSGPEFIPLATPCRALDTRVTGTPLQANVPRIIQIGGVTTGGADCGVPTTAAGAALNFTVTQPQGAGHMAAWPSGGPLPQTAAVNFGAGEDVGNAIDIGLGAGGRVTVQSIVATHLVVDVYGYFTDVEELGSGNTALGVDALAANTTGFSNTALGANALASNTEGVTNTALGFSALRSNTTGGDNTATGQGALASNTTGSDNTALGVGALASNTTGNGNIAIGIAAGNFVTTGSNNIYIGLIGSSLDSDTNDTIRIGSKGTNPSHTRAFIAGIFGTTLLPAGTPVEVNSDGQLGVVLSSRRVKDDIRDMDEASTGLSKLRPVTFRYKAEPATGPRPIEYGLIAEEVAEIYPELVVLDKDGQPSGVRYHVLPAMLLNELQRQQRVIEAQTRLLDELTARLSRLEAKGAAAAGR